MAVSDPEPGSAPTAAQVLGSEGAFAAALSGFSPRSAQLALAAAVEQAVADRGLLVAEAGTGTGKTYAYLVPALLSGARVIVSTGTRALQDQLFLRDLPRVCQALAVRPRTALLKGRGNYLCLYRLDQAWREGRHARTGDVAVLQSLREFAGRSRDGDLDAFPALAEDGALKARVTSSRDNCLGGECPQYGDCFVVKARRAAQEADLVVVNHHLLLADFALKQEGFGEILPGAHAFVIDEAHQFPETASLFLGSALSDHMVRELGTDLLTECGQVSGALAVATAPLQALETALRGLRLALDGLPARGTAAQALQRDSVVDGLAALAVALDDTAAVLSGLEGASAGMDALGERLDTLRQRLARWREAADPVELVDADPEPICAAGDDAVRWYELSQRGFRLSLTPLSVAAPLAQFRAQSRAAWIHVSATLAVADDFRLFQARTGLFDAQTLRLDSPFDYRRQALLYLPGDLPEPNHGAWLEAMAQALAGLVEASRGRALLLFTSHRALRYAAQVLAERVALPLFVQGQAGKHQLLEAFRASGNGVLLGAASFWEGVDVPGEALSLVAIDKLPFAPPDDPVLTARLAAVRAEGGDPFNDWQVPQAALLLKQGVGRLIRSGEDRGVVALLDPRLRGKGYGRRILAALPPMPVVDDLGSVRDFLAP
ncbi:MAG: ATP-dependent DNA helicase [Xanthomonadales bacterium]|nr:ATP-dependent DNA helicase [Xanthomonadales bacterium]